MCIRDRIYSYIMNIDKSNYDVIKGALLYPLANDELNLKYNISGYDIPVSYTHLILVKIIEKI